MSAAAMPNKTMSGPCSFSMTPVPLGIAMPLATANPTRMRRLTQGLHQELLPAAWHAQRCFDDRTR